MIPKEVTDVEHGRQGNGIMGEEVDVQRDDNGENDGFYDESSDEDVRQSEEEESLEGSSKDDNCSKDHNYEVENDSNDFELELGSDDDAGLVEEVRRPEEWNGSDSRPFFILGQTFANKEELRRAINKYAITIGVKLRLITSKPLRVRAVCEKGCPFLLHASQEWSKPGLKVKTLCHEHRCLRVYKNPRAFVKWIAEYFKDKVQERPQYKISNMKKDL